MIEIADAGVVRCNPIISRESDVEHFVHVSVDSKIGVEKDASFVGGELECPKLGPCVFEARSYEGHGTCRK